MKNLLITSLILLFSCFAFGQVPNYCLNPDKIYLDSKDGHNGKSIWKMIKASDAKDEAEKISQTDYSTTSWLPAVVPGTVLNRWFMISLS